MSFLNKHQDKLLSVLRIVAAYMFMLHGTSKLFQAPYIEMFANVQLTSILWSGWHTGSARRLIAHIGIIYPRRCVCAIGHDGSGIFYGPYSTQLLFAYFNRRRISCII